MPTKLCTFKSRYTTPVAFRTCFVRYMRQVFFLKWLKAVIWHSCSCFKRKSFFNQIFPAWKRKRIYLWLKKNKQKAKQTAVLCFKTLTYLNQDEYFAHLKKIKLIRNVVECLWSMSVSRREHSQWKQWMFILNWESSSFHSYFLNNCKLLSFLRTILFTMNNFKMAVLRKSYLKTFRKKYNNQQQVLL